MSGIKTRILILSDTHGLVPLPETQAEDQLASSSRSTPSSSSSSVTSDFDDLVLTSAFRHPLPSADVVIHCGDLTKGSSAAEFTATLSFLAALEAPLKIAIPGNHDAALDPSYWADWRVDRPGGWGMEVSEFIEQRKGYPLMVRGMIDEAARAGVRVLVEEGTYDFVLGNGARLRVYASAWTPAFGQWPFQYRSEHVFEIQEGTDVVVTHGPPRGVLDRSLWGGSAGCGYLMRAVGKTRPRVHCFGHIHEGWAAGLLRWQDGVDGVPVDELSVLLDNVQTMEGADEDGESVRKEKVKRRNAWAEKRARRVNMCSSAGEDGDDGSALPRPFEHGRDTLFVNAAVVDIRYEPRHMPWLVDLELPEADDDDVRRASKTQVIIAENSKRAEAEAASIVGGTSAAGGGRPAPGESWW